MAVSILTAGLFLVVGEPSRFARWQCQSGTLRSPARDAGIRLGRSGSTELAEVLALPDRSAFHLSPFARSSLTVRRSGFGVPGSPIRRFADTFLGPLTSHFPPRPPAPAAAPTPVPPIGHLRRLLAAVGICEIESL